MWTPHRQAWGGSALGSGGLGLRRRTGKAKPTARRPSTPRPPGGCMEQARAPVRPAALCCPPVAAAQGPALPPSVHSSAAGGRGWGAGSWGGGRARLSGRGPQGPGHPPTLQPRHTLPTPGDPRAAPRKGVTHTQTAPSPHWCSYHPGAASPARQSSKEPGPETGPGGPYHGHRPRPPQADTGPPGLPTVSNTRSGQEPHCGLRGSQGFGQADPCPQETRSLCVALQPQT